MIGDGRDATEWMHVESQTESNQIIREKNSSESEFNREPLVNALRGSGVVEMPVDCDDGSHFPASNNDEFQGPI